MKIYHIITLIESSEPDELISWIIAISTSLFTAYIKIREQLQYPTRPTGRTTRILGVWEGKFIQLNSQTGQKMEVNLKLKFKKRGRIFRGKGEFISPINNIPHRIIAEKGRFDGDIIKIEYRNEKKFSKQKGSIMLELDNDGDHLQGLFIGYSNSASSIINGEVILRKPRN